MRAIQGTAASPGVAIGPLYLRAATQEAVVKVHVTDTEGEIERVAHARLEAEEALQQIYQNALTRIGRSDSMIFQIHIMMLRDEDFFAAICEVIRSECANAEYAVWQAAQQFSRMFSEMEDEYMRGRAADVQDICWRMLRCLDPHMESSPAPEMDGKMVVGAVDLMPSETMQIDRGQVLAFVTQKGSRTSHTAILARTMGIPAIVGLECGYKKLQEGALTIVDGLSGEIIQNPDGETLREYEEKRVQLERHRSELKQYKGKKAVTKSHQRITINANINRPEDASLALDNDAEGIGLFRSEFLFMENARVPSEEEQFRAYRFVLEQMGNRQVIIRTIDLGADKLAVGFFLHKEENPALGYRAIRISLDQPELFMTQLRALARASVFGRLSIMLPMVTSIEQIRQTKELLAKAKKSLRREGIAYDPEMKLGIMIETPASVMLSESFAKEVDFFSIGTNDLTQYTLAADRMNPLISKLYDPRHPAILRMIEMTVQNAKKAGIPVGICGESAADTQLLRFYLDIGVDELSVSPSSVLELRKAVLMLD